MDVDVESNVNDKGDIVTNAKGMKEDTQEKKRGLIFKLIKRIMEIV